MQYDLENVILETLENTNEILIRTFFDVPSTAKALIDAASSNTPGRGGTQSWFPQITIHFTLLP